MKTLLIAAAAAGLLVAGAFAFAPRVEIVTEIDIDAPPSAVWAVLADAGGHSDWNPFLVSMEGELVEGATLTNVMRPASGSEMTFRPTVMKVASERELRWRGRFLLPRIADGEHYFLLEERDDGTRLVHGEIFHGVAFWFVDARQFRADFERMNAALKARVHEAPDLSRAIDTGAVDSYLETRIAEARLPGAALAITEGGQIIHLAGYGEAAEGKSVTPDTQFHIASVSKSFTALAVMQLVKAGSVDLDTPVTAYLPEFQTATAGHAGRVTVRHLLNQTSGLSYEGFGPVPPDEQPHSVEDLVALMVEVTPVSEPGATFDYFDPNYGIVARIVEVVSGMAFGDYLERHVFSPLEMNRSRAVTRAEDAPAGTDALAQGYRLDDGAPVPVDERGYLGGSGGVVSTARDLAYYLILQMQDGVFGHHVLATPESLAIMRTPPPHIGSPYAMGWAVLDPEASPVVITSWGDLGSFRADLLLLPSEGLGVALLYNASTDPSVFEAIRAGVVDLLSDPYRE